MGWAGVWHAAVAQFFAEPPFVQIVIGLALAFAALSMLVGLGYVFRPAKPLLAAKPKAEPAAVEVPPTVLTSVTVVPAPQDVAPAPAPVAAVAKPNLRGRKILPPGLRDAPPRPSFRSVPRG